MLSSNPLKTMQRSSPKRSYRPKTFAYSNKSNEFFATFSTDSKSAFFYTHIALLAKKFLSHIFTFCKL
jgi:hypothetical protein